MSSKTKLAMSVAAAFAIGYASQGMASVTNTPAAIADALISFTNFQFTTGGSALCTSDPTQTPGGVCRTDGSGNPILTIFGGNESASVKGDLGPLPLTLPAPYSYEQATGVGGVPLGSDILGISGSDGPNAGAFTPGSPHNAQAITDTFVGGISQSIGNSLLGTASVILQATASLFGAGLDSKAVSVQDLSTEFNILNVDDITVDLSFDAHRFWRGGLGQPGVEAKGSSTFEVVIYDYNLITGEIGEELMIWQPGLATTLACDGGFTCVVGGTGIGTQFLLNGNRTAPTNGGDSVRDTTASYLLSVNLPQPADGHAYKFTITGTTEAQAGTPVPEPSVLALLGLGLIGLSRYARRKLV